MRFAVILSTLCLVAVPAVAVAQSNPFLPPSGGLSRRQVEEIVRRQVQEQIAQNPAGVAAGGPAAPGAVPNGSPVAPGATAGIPSQGNPTNGLPGGQVAGGAMTPASADDDPVAELMSAGGSFVGCVSSTPIFKDKAGRRVYFTSKELRNSHEARRFARC